MTTTRLYLIRHGQVDGYDTGRINGQTDVALTALGRSQAEAAARRVVSVSLDGVYSSDLARADFGAARVAETRNMGRATFAALREMHFGCWEGLTHPQVQDMEGAPIDELFGRMLREPTRGGESIADVHARVMPCLGLLLERHAGRSLCVVAHSGVNRVILSSALCGGPDLFWKLDQGYGCLNVIDYGGPQGAVVRLMNEANSLAGDGGAVL